MENAYAAAIKDLQAEVIILRTGLNAIIQALAVDGAISREGIDSIISGLAKSIDIVKFRDEERQQAEFGLHEKFAADVTRYFQDGQRAGFHPQRN